jgi:hypothetical protein
MMTESWAGDAVPIPQAGAPLLVGSAQRDELIAKVQEVPRLLDPFPNPKETNR